MSRLCLYYRATPERDRWFPGDRFVRPFVRRVLRGKPQMGGVDKVFYNLCLGLDRLGVSYQVNLPFQELQQDDRVGVLGRGKASLQGYDRPNPIVAGIGLMTHPSEWPELCQQFPIRKYLQHSPWAADVYRPYYRDRVDIWPVGIDTEQWKPQGKTATFDFLIYDKIRWDHEQRDSELLSPILSQLTARSLTFTTIRYGEYSPEKFHELLGRSRAMIFLCEHESQGLAYQECLSSGVPILAWDQGSCLDPNRIAWGMPTISATSVPYFDDRCGERFTSMVDFSDQLDLFMDRLNTQAYHPRNYMLENLTLEKCAHSFLGFFEGS